MTQFETIVLDSHDTLEDVLTGLLEDDVMNTDEDEAEPTEEPEEKKEDTNETTTV